MFELNQIVIADILPMGEVTAKVVSLRLEADGYVGLAPHGLVHHWDGVFMHSVTKVRPLTGETVMRHRDGLDTFG